MQIYAHRSKVLSSLKSYSPSYGNIKLSKLFNVHLKLNPTDGGFCLLVIIRYLRCQCTVGNGQHAYNHIDKQLLVGHVEQLDAGNDFRHDAPQRPHVQTVVQAAPEAHLGRAVRDRLDLLLVHGVHVLHVERPPEVDDLHQQIIPVTGTEHYIVWLEVGVHDPQTLQTHQAFIVDTDRANIYYEHILLQ